MKSHLDGLQKKTDECTTLILDAKEKYVRCMSNKLNDPLTAPKTYRPILNCFLNNRNIPVIPPLLVNGDIITKCFRKADLFNKLFWRPMYTPLHKLPPLYLKTDKKLCNLSINENDISTRIRNLDPNKSPGWDNLSVRMIKLFGDSLIYPVKCIFERALQEGKYPDCWKKANVVPVYKRESKSLIQNYRPISLLPFLGMIFERLTYKDFFNTFIAIIFSRKINLALFQVILAFLSCCLIIHRINFPLDCNPNIDVRGVFLDISKEFDKEWHEGLLFKLETYDIGAELLNIFRGYLQERQPRVALNGQSSSSEAINSRLSFVFNIYKCLT